MALLVPTAGDQNLLGMALRDASPEAQTLKLATNAVTPAKGDTAATYTEAAGSGYAAAALARASWNAPSTSGSNGIITYSAAQVFNFTGAITITLYFVIKATAGTILWAENIAVANTGVAFQNGDSLTLTPQITLN